MLSECISHTETNLKARLRRPAPAALLFKRVYHQINRPKERILFAEGGRERSTRTRKTRAVLDIGITKTSIDGTNRAIGRIGRNGNNIDLINTSITNRRSTTIVMDLIP